MISNDTQRVLLSERFVDDLYYAANVIVERTEVVFNTETVVFVKLMNDAAPTTLSLPASDIDTFIAAYTAYQHEHEDERLVADPSAFRTWLTERSGDPVGSFHAGPHCPPALWLSEAHGHPYTIGTSAYGPCDTEELFPAPHWMCDFVKQLMSEPHQGSVVAEHALELLNAVDPLFLGDLDEHPF